MCHSQNPCFGRNLQHQGFQVRCAFQGPLNQHVFFTIKRLFPQKIHIFKLGAVENE